MALPGFQGVNEWVTTQKIRFMWPYSPSPESSRSTMAAPFVDLLSNGQFQLI